MADELDRAGLRRPVDQRAGRDFPETAGRAGVRPDLMQVPVADQPGHDAGVAVRERRQRVGVLALRVMPARVGERGRTVVAGQHGDAPRLCIDLRQPRLQPFQLLHADAALVVAGRVGGVEQHDARVFGIDHGVGAAVPCMLRAMTGCTARHVGGDPGVPVERAPAVQRRHPARAALRERGRVVDEPRQRIVRVETLGPAQALGRAHGDGFDARLGQGRALAQQVVVAGQAGPGEAQPVGPQCGAGASHEVGHDRITARFPVVVDVRLWTPVGPGAGRWFG